MFFVLEISGCHLTAIRCVNNALARNRHPCYASLWLQQQRGLISLSLKHNPDSGPLIDAA
jgi:hypothetical protein